MSTGLCRRRVVQTWYPTGETMTFPTTATSYTDTRLAFVYVRSGLHIAWVCVCLTPM